MPEPAPEQPTAPYEELLVLAIGCLERQDSAAVEQLLAAHPAHAARLRGHLSRLGNLGLARTAPAASDSFPEQLGDFKLLRRLGGGGMGVVFLARQQSLGRNVALKLVRHEHLWLPGARERFRREVAATSKLQHPGIVPVYDAGEDAGVPWLAMEHIVGASLDGVMKKVAGKDPATLRGADLWAALVEALPTDTPAPDAPSGAERQFHGTWVTACLQLVRAVALALHHAHERGVLHRDLKPSNVMLTPDGRALLLDFGLAVATGDARLTRSGSLLGTLAYMSPEQVRGDMQAVDARSDVYSLAITAYELLTLQLPFAAETDAAVRERVMAGALPPLRELNRAVPREVELVLRKACDVDPARRYADAAAFAEDLGNLLELRPIRAQAPSAWLLLRRWSQRHPARATSAAAGILLFLVAPTVFLWQAKAANRDIQRALEQATAQRDLAREAVDTMLARVADEQLLLVPKLQRVRRDLLASAKSFYERFLAADPADLDMLEQTARAALRMVFVEGDLGQVDIAAATAERAVELVGRLRERRPGDDAVALLVADALLTRGRVRLTQVRPEDALADFAAADRLARDVFTRMPSHPLAIVHLLGIERGVSLAMRALDRRQEYAASLQRLAELWRERGSATAGHDYRDAALDHVLCAGVDEVRFLYEEARHDEARAACDRIEAIAAAVAGEDVPMTARIALATVPVLRARLTDDVVEQERQLLECLRQCEAVLAGHPEQAQVLRLLANTENGLGLLLTGQPDRRQEATAWFERALQTARAIVAADPTVVENRANLAADLVNRGSQYKDGGDARRALELFVEAEQLAAECCAVAPTRRPWQQYRYNAVWFLGQTCGDLGDHAGQADAARRLAALRPEDGKTRRIAAELMAQAITALRADARVPADERDRRRGELERDAMQQLELAAANGCTDLDWLRDGEPFAPLRELPGFADVLARVAANAAAAGK